MALRNENESQDRVNQFLALARKADEWAETMMDRQLKDSWQLVAEGYRELALLKRRSRPTPQSGT